MGPSCGAPGDGDDGDDGDEDDDDGADVDRNSRPNLVILLVRGSEDRGWEITDLGRARW